MKRLLVVVDDWEALEVYETRLEPFFEVRGAPFGSEGLRLAQEERPDRILLDLTFEDMHAQEACEKLRAIPGMRTVPLTIILNEGEEKFELAGAFPLPGDHVLHRPYDLNELIALLET